MTDSNKSVLNLLESSRREEDLVILVGFGSFSGGLQNRPVTERDLVKERSGGWFSGGVWFHRKRERERERRGGWCCDGICPAEGKKLRVCGCLSMVHWRLCDWCFRLSSGRKGDGEEERKERLLVFFSGRGEKRSERRSVPEQ
ncbi:hypothetical protein HAX54_017291 [Datura stramonium]|uniref:Uncharacterized protein n=1 Tax=Datura stramonium TaxID=4076 RepID=A0ABS8UKF0_DATST|nr:hypothetical protein [Datura stramonium]